MLDVDAGRQHEPISRISLHESTKRDGVFDKHTVFADNLVFPRMILPLDKGILTNETHSDDVLLADRHQRRRRRRQEGRCSTPASATAAAATSSRRRAVSSGGSTTGFTAPTTRSASVGRRAGSSASPPAVRAPSGACRRTTTGRSGW